MTALFLACLLGPPLAVLQWLLVMAWAHSPQKEEG